MESQRFDRLTTALATGGHRRRVIAGLVAGTAMVFGSGVGTDARTRRRRCTFCPQRACCSCKIGQVPTKCSLIEAKNHADIVDACQGFCGTDEVNTVNFAVPEFSNICGADFGCNVKPCPIRV